MTPDESEDQSGCLVTSQSDRREVLQNERRAREQGPSTFRSFADAFANETRGGRFAKSSDATTIKPLPPSSPWSSSQPSPGDEPQLGYDINAVPDLGFPKSVAPTPDPLAVETATERSGTADPDSPAPSFHSEGDGR